MKADLVIMTLSTEEELKIDGGYRTDGPFGNPNFRRQVKKRAPNIFFRSLAARWAVSGSDLPYGQHVWQFSHKGCPYECAIEFNLNGNIAPETDEVLVTCHALADKRIQIFRAFISFKLFVLLMEDSAYLLAQANTHPNYSSIKVAECFDYLDTQLAKYDLRETTPFAVLARSYQGNFGPIRTGSRTKGATELADAKIIKRKVEEYHTEHCKTLYPDSQFFEGIRYNQALKSVKSSYFILVDTIESSIEEILGEWINKNCYDTDGLSDKKRNARSNSNNEREGEGLERQSTSPHAGKKRTKLKGKSGTTTKKSYTIEELNAVALNLLAEDNGVTDSSALNDFLNKSKALAPYRKKASKKLDPT